jgi:NADPH-dependent curcumin reductase CurA
MAEWLKQGRLRYQETIYEMLENAPRAFIGLFQGENTGKALVKV